MVGCVGRSETTRSGVWGRGRGSVEILKCTRRARPLAYNKTMTIDIYIGIITFVCVCVCYDLYTCNSNIIK